MFFPNFTLSLFMLAWFLSVQSVNWSLFNSLLIVQSVNWSSFSSFSSLLIVQSVNWSLFSSLLIVHWLCNQLTEVYSALYCLCNQLTEVYSALYWLCNQLTEACYLQNSVARKTSSIWTYTNTDQCLNIYLSLFAKHVNVIFKQDMINWF